MQYNAPRTLAEASALLQQASGSEKVALMAGGTDLLARLAGGAQVPDILIDLKKIPDLNIITRHASGAYTIGAAVCGAAISEHSQLKQDWPGIVEAMDLIGSVQIQSRASLAGNLCNASPAADSVPALLAARARCCIDGASGKREVAVEEIIVAPGRTSLRKDEFIVSITLPARLPRSADAYLRMIPRTEMDIAVAGAAVSLTLDNAGIIKEIYLALGAVSPVPLLVPEAAKVLLGTALDDRAMDNFARLVRSACRPINDKRGSIEYRTDVAAVLARRAAAIAFARARSNQSNPGGIQ